MNELPKNPYAEHSETAATQSPAPESRPSGQGFTAGTVVAGRYRIDAYLARGGMGQVFRAHDLALDVPLALKTIRPEIASNPSSLRSFKQEVLLARSVSHPNVCRIFDLGHDEPTGVSFLTMEFLPGETLSSRIKMKGALPSEESLPLVRQMAEALDAAHRAGIVHRDFKSPNVMVVPNGNGGRAVITDFGLAMTVGKDVTSKRGESPENVRTKRPTSIEESDPSTPVPESGETTRVMDPLERAAALDTPDSELGAIVGTPAYMSPEQVRGGPIGPASDLYSLGVVLFEMCTGQLPFRGATPWETAQAHLTTVPPSPRSLAEVEETWERTILRLLAKDPAKRYTSAHEAVLALEGRVDGTPVARHSLPAEQDAFVGRTTELATLASRLETQAPGGETGTRLLTLQGPGGTGKTRVVTKYGWESLGRWPGGVWFCDLSEARTADGIAVAVAKSLNVPLGKEDPVVQLGNAIAGRRKSLLILDNFEQVVGYAEATLGRWLERATEASFLVTSRERLQLPQETILELEPLDPTTQGVELFEVRAQGHRPGFIVDASNRPQVEKIVQSLDGLPLAIELAAARLRMLNLEQLRDRLRDRFKILAGGKKGRHATLRTTVDWSWDLLQPWEQSAMAQVSVFEGGFTLEAAEAVVDLSKFEDDPFVLDVIQSLVDKSWLRAKVVLGAPRFHMYVTVQEYASAKLRAESAHAGAERSESEVASSDSPTALTEVEVRHGGYFAGMGTEEAIERLNRHEGVEQGAALQLELDNLVVACRRAMVREDEDTAASSYLAADVVLTLQGPLVLSVQLGSEVLGLTKEPTRRGRVLRALANAERLSGRMEEARAHFEAALALARELGDRRIEGVVLGGLGVLHGYQGRMEEARAYYEAALAIHREVGNRGSEGVVLVGLGLLHREQGRMEEARAHYEAALAIHREVGNRGSEGAVLVGLGLLHKKQGRMEEARAHFEAALALHREVGNRHSEGSVLGNLGNLHFEQGRMEEARAHHEAALALHREVGNRGSEGIELANLGNLHKEQGRMEEAHARFEAALAIHREVGDRGSEGIVLGNLGVLRMDQGRMEEARAHYEAALAVHREVGDRHSEAIVLGNLGLLHREQGRLEEARAHYEAALTLAREVGNPWFEGAVLGNLGLLCMDQGRMDEARAHCEAALAIHREVGNRSFEGTALGDLGKLHARQHRTEDARRCFEEGLAILRDLSDMLYLGVVLCGLGEFEHQLGHLEAARAALQEAEAIAADLAVGPESELPCAIEELRHLLARAGT